MTMPPDFPPPPPPLPPEVAEQDDCMAAGPPPAASVSLSLALSAMAERVGAGSRRAGEAGSRERGAEDRARGEWARGRARGGERGAQSAARAAGRRRAAAAAEKERALPAAARAAPPGNRDPARTRAVLQRRGLARSAGDVPAAPAPRSATGSHAHTRPGPRRLPVHVLPPRALASQAPTHGRAASSGERRTPRPRQPCRCRDTWEGQPGSSVHPTLPPPPSCSLAPSVGAGARGSLWLLHAEARLELGTESSPTVGPGGWGEGGHCKTAATG